MMPISSRTTDSTHIENKKAMDAIVPWLLCSSLLGWGCTLKGIFRLMGKPFSFGSYGSLPMGMANDHGLLVQSLEDRRFNSSVVWRWKTWLDSSCWFAKANLFDMGLMGADCQGTGKHGNDFRAVKGFLDKHSGVRIAINRFRFGWPSGRSADQGASHGLRG
jgi:hypothetical protein